MKKILFSLLIFPSELFRESCHEKSPAMGLLETLGLRLETWNVRGLDGKCISIAYAIIRHHLTILVAVEIWHPTA